jgi:hypothetical protein
LLTINGIILSCKVSGARKRKITTPVRRQDESEAGLEASSDEEENPVDDNLHELGWSALNRKFAKVLNAANLFHSDRSCELILIIY